MAWLPGEHDGVRTCAQARSDLETIAGSDYQRLAAVVIDADGGSRSRTVGPLSARGDGGDLDVCVGDRRAFRFDACAFRGAWLWSADDADYYQLDIDFGWGRVVVADAYNDGWTAAGFPEPTASSR